MQMTFAQACMASLRQNSMYWIHKEICKIVGNKMGNDKTWCHKILHFLQGHGCVEWIWELPKRYSTKGIGILQTKAPKAHQPHLQ
jgi:hypothetical protein